MCLCVCESECVCVHVRVRVYVRVNLAKSEQRHVSGGQESAYPADSHLEQHLFVCIVPWIFSKAHRNGCFPVFVCQRSASSGS